MLKDFFFFFHFFPHIPVVYTKVSVYTLVAHTHTNFFSHIIYTHKILLYTFSFTYIKNSSLFFLYIDTTFVHNALFFALVQTKYMHKTNDNHNNKKQTLVPQVIEIK